MPQNLERLSRNSLTVINELPVSVEQYQLGCMQRIANAVERMICGRDELERTVIELRSELKHKREFIAVSERSYKASRGHLTRLKRENKRLKEVLEEYVPEFSVKDLLKKK